MLIAALLTAALVQANPAPPTVSTGVADAVTTAAATVSGTVDPGGAATTYQFEYGTSTSYGLTTPSADAGAGSAPATVHAALSHLTSDTTYHYRLVATNPAGTARGGDRSFTTAAPPRAPSISSLSATGIGPTSATLRASVNPNRMATTLRFEIGATTAYGTQTAPQSLAAGASSTTLAAAVGGLAPNTRYHYRAVATNAAGTTRGGDRSLTTARTPTGVALTPSTTRPVWGSGLTVSGTVSGQGSVNVALERQDFPFSAGFTELSVTKASSSGRFSFTVPALFSTTRLRVTTRTPLPISSAVITESVAAKVGLRTQALRNRRVRLTGAIWPALAQGRVSLQRHTRSGRWVPSRRASPRPVAGDHSRYSFIVHRGSGPREYRIVVVPNDGGAHARGTSRVVTV